jgi:PAS domain S-box-containing protein
MIDAPADAPRGRWPALRVPTPESLPALVLSVTLVILVADLLVLTVTDRLWHHGLSGWAEILLNDAALSLLCAAVLVPVLRGWQRRARLAERAMDIASDGFAVIDAGKRLLRTNQGYRTMVGLPAQQPAIPPSLQPWQADGSSTVDEHLERARREGVSRSFAWQSRIDGSSLPVQVTTAWLGDYQCFASFVRDESARIAAEAQLREQASATRRLLDAMAEGVLGFDDQGRCSFANRSAARMLGLASPQELVGRGAAGFFAAAVPMTDLEWLQAAAARGSRETALRRHDDTLLAVECNCHAVGPHDGSAAHVVTFIDIGERIRARRERERAARQLRDTFELAPVGMARIALDGRLVEVNSAMAEMLDRPREQLLGLPWQALTHADDVAAEAADWQLLLQGGGSRRSLEKRMRRGAQDTVWVLQGLALVRDDEERPDYFIVVAKDISLRKQAETAVRAAEVALRANAAKTEFLSRMSHELRTPLNAVLGFAQLLRMDKRHPLPSAAAQRVERIEQAGAHLLALIGDVLDLSRIESGQLAVAPEGVDVGDVAAACAHMLRDLAQARAVDIVLGEAGDAASPPLLVHADRLRLRQVLLNLLSNAIKYNRPHGRATVAWQRQGAWGEIRVVDTGIGLSPAQQAHLFEPFNRLGAERTGVEGTGIGLVLARHLVQLMGGELALSSDLGLGTTVTVRLPLAPATANPVADATGTDGRAAGGRLRLLYAEDNPVNVEIVRAILQARPMYELRVAESAAQALAMARDEVPDLMLVDMHLGDASGLELATALLADARTRGIRLVALSADALPAQIDAALRLGFASYLTKPVEVQRLLRVLDEAAGSD